MEIEYLVVSLTGDSPKTFTSNSNIVNLTGMYIVLQLRS